jgi:hypothetical protein
MRTLLAAACALLLAACESSGKTGYVPYVPGPGFEETVEIWLETPDSGAAAVGDPITLHASRQSGPWQLKDSTVTGTPACERLSPITREFEVASKVEWRIEPEGAVTWNAPGPPDYDRQIRFTRPGRYRVVAVSRGCAGSITSKPVEVVVR